VLVTAASLETILEEPQLDHITSNYARIDSGKLRGLLTAMVWSAYILASDQWSGCSAEVSKMVCDGLLDVCKELQYSLQPVE